MASPFDGFIKVKSGCLDKENRKMGIGVIVRYNMGEVLATLSAAKDYIIALDIAEASAALRASNFCRKLGLHRVILEGDALQVVQTLRKEGRNWSRYDHLIEDTKRELNCLFKWLGNDVRHNLNGAIHRLANETLYMREENFLIEEVPNIFMILSLSPMLNCFL